MDKEFTVRWSRAEDREQIKKLLYTEFGCMVENEGGFEDIENGRYLILILKNGEIAAVTGFQHRSSYPGIEITWTTTKLRYRHRGYMQELFRRLLATTDQDVYCCCWRLKNEQVVNLHTIMNMFGFKEVISDMNNYKVKYGCPSGRTCPYYQDERNECSCAKDLFLRPGVER